jgi:hypothetical protein
VSFFHIDALQCSWRLTTTDGTISVATAVVASSVDKNSLLFDISDVNILKLLHVQNSLALHVISLSERSSTALILGHLHWLLVLAHI